MFKSEMVNDVFVITDDNEIANIGRNAGAEIIWQPTEMCNYGHWGGAVTHLWTMQTLEDMGYEFDTHVSIPSTCIWNTPDDVDGAVRLSLKHNANIIEACVEWSKAWFSGRYTKQDGGPTVQWLQRYDNAVEGYIYYHTGNICVTRKSVIRQMRQSFIDSAGRLLPEIVTGTADITKAPYFAAETDMPHSLPWVMPWYAQFDINTPQDWIIAETIFKEVILNEKAGN
jgi:CMP-N-acetylneuraminic acid synthetase